jgi:signal transduction histidine kinase
MNRSQESRPRWWRGLRFRLGAIVAISIVIGDMLTYPVYGWVLSFFHPEELPPASFGESAAFFSVSLVYAAVIGSLLGWAVARLSLRRLRDIAAEASAAFDAEDDLPGPFEESGNDEITRMARALNSMRLRVTELMQRLEERDSRRNEWVAQVAHDLRTPLAALTTCLDHASDKIAREKIDPGEFGELVKTARIDADRVTALAEDLLEIARLEVDDLIDTESVLPGEIVEYVVRGLQPIATENDIRLEVDIDAEISAVEADGRLLCRALENLVINSLQHASGRVLVKAHAADGKVRFEVKDDGPGLPERQGRVLFAELKQQRSRADSAGLGLIVAQRVAQAHGGEIGARNAEAGGASIWFEIPVYYGRTVPEQK